MKTFWQFMKRNYKVVLLITALSAILWSFMPHKKEDPEKDRLLLELLTFVLEKGHYDPIAMDDAFSKNVFKEPQEVELLCSLYTNKGGWTTFGKTNEKNINF